jgi:glycosyltransferase involved in cell wall biosynthesis
MIAFDLQAIQSIGNSERGIARFVTEIVRHLIAGPHEANVDLFLWNDRMPRPDRLDDLGLGDRLRSFSQVAGSHVDVLHVNSPFELPSIVDQFPPLRARRLVTTCYDMIPYLFPEHYIANRFASAAYRRRLGMIATSDAVVTDSWSAADDVIAHLGVDPARVTVLGAGVSAQFRPPESPLEDRIEMLRSDFPRLSARYILVPTAADWRKNSIGAIEAFSRLPSDLRERHQLVLFCRLTSDQRAHLESVAVEAGVGDRVIFTGFVHDDRLVALYQSAELVMFPTFYEGFGLPVLEARRCGARVICSNTSSLPEVLVDVRARFNPFDLADVTDTLRRALTDATTIGMLERVPDPGFSWDLAVDRLVEVYDGLRPEAVSTTPRQTPPAPRQVAIVGSLKTTFGSLVDDVVIGHIRSLVARLIEGSVPVEPVVYGFPHQPNLVFDVGSPVRPFAELATAYESGQVDVIVYVVGERPAAQLRAAMNLFPGHVVQLTGSESVSPDGALSVHVAAGCDVLDELMSVLGFSHREAVAAST